LVELVLDGFGLNAWFFILTKISSDFNFNKTKDNLTGIGNVVVFISKPQKKEPENPGSFLNL